ncbi:MAG: efflux RND transporter periplasmic adaptor subunit [Verrucomicrobia bacterium]|nr:efflux RND transporter periplasmic adaptor subunit [Verrucomicrobiota bacterium]
MLEIRRASLEAATFRIEQQEMNLREARDQLAKASTFSPIDGTVTKLESELGDRVVGTGQFAGTEIMRIANLSTMEVRVDVSETDITSVKIGDEASIEIDALPSRRFEGVVTEIANSAQTSQAGNQEQLTTFSVRVRFNEVDTAMRPGMTATTDIRTQTVDNVVRVPLQSVTVRSREVVEEVLGISAEVSTPTESAVAGQARGRPGAGSASARRNNDILRRVVFVINPDNTVRMVPVETGIADARFIEITQGLSAGDRVVTGPHGALTRELQHGSTIRELTLAPGQRSGRP